MLPLVAQEASVAPSPLLTDSLLPRMDMATATDLYRCTAKTILVLQNAKIPFWAAAGTLLGAVRHEGIIPWDDDIDLAFPQEWISTLLSLEEELDRHGLAIYTQGAYFKIFEKDGALIARPSSEEGEEYYPWRHPFVDLFPYRYLDTLDRWVHAALRLQVGFPDDYFLPEEVERLSWAPFGPFYLPVPTKAENILDRLYGYDWGVVAYADYVHRLEQRLERVKVTLTDFSPAPWENDPLWDRFYTTFLP